MNFHDTAFASYPPSLHNYTSGSTYECTLAT